MIKFFKILIGVLIVVLIGVGWYVYTSKMADKTRNAISWIVEIEKEINLFDNDISRRYAANEIEQAKRYLQESKDAYRRGDNVSRIEWLKQAKEVIIQIKEKDRIGRKEDYDLCISKGKENANSGLWDLAISEYRNALKYKPNDRNVENEIRIVQKKKKIELDKQESEKKQKGEGISYVEEKKKQEVVFSKEQIKEKELEVVEKVTKPLVSQESAKKYSEMVFISSGEFEMGNNEGDASEKPVHKIHLNSYWIDKYEVTNEQYAKFLNDYGKDLDDDGNIIVEEHIWGVKKKGDKWEPQSGYEKHPVICVTWYGANQYAKYYGKRLPTEAEWERACKSGNNTRYSFGDSESLLGEYSWYMDNSNKSTHPVGQKKPNIYGIYDMHGNVWEWCSDWYDSGYYAKSPKDNPKGPDTGSSKVLRGGAWNYMSIYCLSSFRIYFAPDSLNNCLGFRCVSE